MTKFLLGIAALALVAFTPEPASAKSEAACDFGFARCQARLIKLGANTPGAGAVCQQRCANRGATPVSGKKRR